MPTNKDSARETLMYLVLFSTLYMSAYHLGDLFFDLINRAFPDPATARFEHAPWMIDRMRWSVASLIASFPVFLFMSRLLHREITADPARRASMVRRWLTCLTLFLGVSVLLCDSTVAIDGLLGGELTIRFVLKVATVALIGGGIFSYYLRDLRGVEQDARS